MDFHFLFDSIYVYTFQSLLVYSCYLLQVAISGTSPAKALEHIFHPPAAMMIRMVRSDTKAAEPL